MSMHKIPLTPIEESGLRAHGLDIGKPSQLSDAFRQGVRYASTQLPIQGGESVEVVGYGCTGQIEVLKHVPLTGGMKVSGRAREKYNVPLMTVAQHKRILAASVGSGDPVAWRVTGRDGLTVTAQYPEWAEADCLLTITPLYTHPADQVADDLTMVKVSGELLEQIAVELEHDNDRYFLGRELRALLEQKP